MHLRHITWLLLLHLHVANGIAQVQEEPTRPGTSHAWETGIGMAVTSFSSNIAYYVSPHLAYRHGRHWVSFTPFYGRLEPLRERHDVAVGFDYRFHPLRIPASVRFYIPVGVHYVHTWTGTSTGDGLFYTSGAGTETDLGKRLVLSLDAHFGVGHTLASSFKGPEIEGQVPAKKVNFYFLPLIRIAYRL